MLKGGLSQGRGMTSPELPTPAQNPLQTWLSLVVQEVAVGPLQAAATAQDIETVVQVQFGHHMLVQRHIAAFRSLRPKPVRYGYSRHVSPL